MNKSERPYLFHTSDHGETWDKITGFGVQNLNDAFVLNNNDIFIAGDKGTLLISSDGGANYKSVTVGSDDYNLVKTVFSDVNNGYVIEQSGLIFITTDGGDSWSVNTGLLNNFNSGETLIDFEANDLNVAYVLLKDAIGNARVIETSDIRNTSANANEADNWSGIEVETPIVNDVYSNGTEVWAVSDKGTILSFDNAEGSVIALENENNFNDVSLVSNKVLFKNTSNVVNEYTPSTGVYNDNVGTINGILKSNNSNTGVITQAGLVFNYNNGTQIYNGLFLATPTGIDFENQNIYVYWNGASLYASSNIVLPATQPWNAVIDDAHVHDNGTDFTISVTADEKTYNLVAGAWVPVQPVGVLKDAFWNGSNGLLLTSNDIYETTDHGVTWSPLSVSVTDLTKVVKFDNKVIATTSTGGWKELTSGAFADFYPITGASGLNDLALNGTTLVAVGDNQVILNYNSTTQRFDYTEKAGSENLEKVALDDNDNIYAVNSMGVLLHGDPNSLTIDERVFDNLSTDPSLNAGDDHFVNSITTYEDAASKIHVVASAENSVVPNSPTVLSLVIGGTGQEWEVTALDNIIASEVALIGTSGVAIAIGNGGEIYKSTDVSTGTWTSASQISAFELADAQMVTPSIGYAVGNTGNILKTTDGGQSWIFQGSPLTENWKSVNFINENTGVVISDNEVIYTTNGTDWTLINTPAPATYKDVAMYNTTTAYIAAESGGLGEIVKVNLTGATVSVETVTGTANPLTAITKVRSQTLAQSGSMFAVGNGGTIVQFDTDEVAPWFVNNNANADDYTTNYVSIQFTDYLIGYAVGASGTILKTINRGESWFDFELDQPTANLVHIDFTTETEGVVVTTNGVEQFEDLTNRFSARFWYDELGRIVLSQNTRQFNKVPSAYSYSIYDELGRVIEVGEVASNDLTSSITSASHPSQINTSVASGQVISSFYPETFVTVAPAVDVLSTDIAKDKYWKFIRNGSKTEVTRTYYSHLNTIATENSKSLFDVEAADYEKNTRNRIASVSYMNTWVADEFTKNSIGAYQYVSATHYNYDIHGNVNSLLQDYGNNLGLAGNFIADNANTNREIDLFKTDYTYDLISGNVIETIYQKNHKEEYHHQFEYDADNRISAVQTSHDGINWETDVKYSYYKHGPLARVEIGDNQIQACDYAYTIQGWIKGVNSNTLIASDDIGNDDGSEFAKDEFAFSLGYFDGDYSSISGTTPFKANSYTPSTNLAGKNMYNGNISSRTNVVGELGGPTETAYAYDQLNRLKIAQTVTGGTSTDVHRTNYTYDPNGNILELNRWDNLGTKMDEFFYDYENVGSGFKRNTNKLRRVLDVATASLVTTDLKPGQLPLVNGDNTTDNYQYDDIGNLTKDVLEGIDDIEWRVDGKIAAVRGLDQTDQSDVEFTYDPMGNRISKLVKKRTNGIISDPSQWVQSTYVRDAQGNVMMIYKTELASLSTNTYISTTKATEANVYGSSRLGVENLNLTLSTKSTVYYLDNFSLDGNLNLSTDVLTLERGKKQFELSDHLGNVNTTVSDVKFLDGNGDFSAYVTSASEVYPFGMKKPNPKNVSGGYRYGFNGMEKDDELHEGSYDFGARMYDCRIGRWSAVDPKAVKYSGMSPYIYVGDNPIIFIDPTGEELDYNGTEKAFNKAKAIIETYFDKKVILSRSGEFNIVSLKMAAGLTKAEIAKINKMPGFKILINIIKDPGITSVDLVNNDSKVDGGKFRGGYLEGAQQLDVGDAEKRKLNTLVTGFGLILHETLEAYTDQVVLKFRRPVGSSLAAKKASFIGFFQEAHAVALIGEASLYGFDKLYKQKDEFLINKKIVIKKYVYTMLIETDPKTKIKTEKWQRTEISTLNGEQVLGKTENIAGVKLKKGANGSTAVDPKSYKVVK
mgnify:CR=1 FL=1